MRITQQDVEQFAKWSGDCNPIHVDPQAAKGSAFGGTIVHGTLSTIESLRCMRAQMPRLAQIVALDVEFRNEIRPNTEYAVDIRRLDDSSIESKSVGVASATVLSGSRAVMVATAEFARDASQASEFAVDWHTNINAHCVRSSFETTRAETWLSSDFRRGEEVYGMHRFGNHQPSSDSILTTCQERVLGLCSFIVGMKAPGLSSLFTRLKVQFHNTNTASQQYIYRLVFRDYDPYFRVLETELEIADADGTALATCQIESYVRFPLAQPDPNYYAK